MKHRIPDELAWWRRMAICGWLLASLVAVDYAVTLTWGTCA